MSVNQQNVFMIGWEYPPHNSGGLGVACDGLTQALSGQNTQIYFTLPYNFTGGGSHMQVLSCFDDDWQNQNAPPFLSYNPAFFASDDAVNMDALKLRALPSSEMEQKVVEYADVVSKHAHKLRNNFSVIHAHDWMSFPAGIQAKQKTGKPLITHVHSTEYDRAVGDGNQYIVSVEKQGLELSDHIVAVSSYTKQLLVHKYQVNPQKISVVHNGILPSVYGEADFGRSFAKKRPVVVFMGRLTLQKGAEYFLQLASKILQRNSEVLFILAGDGDMYHELLFKNAGRKLSSSVLFSGFVRDKQKMKLLNRADVFIMPSLSEPFGLVALEAVQMNTPVIVSKNSGVKEVLPSAIQVDFWDVEKMTSEVLKIIEDKDHHSSLIARQQNELQKITWENSAQKMKKVYRRAFLG